MFKQGRFLCSCCSAWRSFATIWRGSADFPFVAPNIPLIYTHSIIQPGRRWLRPKAPLNTAKQKATATQKPQPLLPGSSRPFSSPIKLSKERPTAQDHHGFSRRSHISCREDKTLPLNFYRSHQQRTGRARKYADIPRTAPQTWVEVSRGSHVRPQPRRPKGSTMSLPILLLSTVDIRI